MVAREKREKRNVKMNSGILMVGVVGGGQQRWRERAVAGVLWSLQRIYAGVIAGDMIKK